MAPLIGLPGRNVRGFILIKQVRIALQKQRVRVILIRFRFLNRDLVRPGQYRRAVGVRPPSQRDRFRQLPYQVVVPGAIVGFVRRLVEGDIGGFAGR